MDGERIIKALNLKPLPFEGGYYRQTYESRETVPVRVLADRYGEDKSCGTAIYYLLTSEPGCFSAMHKLLTDEVWHFYGGDPVELLLLYQDGSGETRLLGSDILGGHTVQTVVPAGTWHGARLLEGGRFALMGTTMAPGFTINDYTHGKREELIPRFPDFEEQIVQLTRTSETT